MKSFFSAHKTFFPQISRDWHWESPESPKSPQKACTKSQDVKLKKVGRNKQQVHVRDSHHDDCAHVFGEKSYIAGIPIDAQCTAVGKRLKLTLQNRPHEFVALAIQEIEEIIARPEVDPVESGEAQRRRRTQDFDPPSTSHYATMRRRLVDSISNSAEPSGREDEDLPPDEADGILRGSIKFAELVDVMYFWALGEAYLQHPQMQSDMRKRLRRKGQRPLAAGDDRLELKSRVQLMDGPLYKGHYMIGSVNFVRTPDSNDGEEDRDSRQGIQWGSADHFGKQNFPIPPLDAIWNSGNGKMMMALEGDSPTRMMRQGAARSYNTYQHWGYFQRRMTISREQDGTMAAEIPIFNSGPSEVTDSPYGTSVQPWRFFESVPNKLSRMRSKEATEVSNRHLRALFGDEEECITTISAFQQMTYEAKWFGRALYDAEDIVLQKCCSLLTS